ncbi:MAG: DUF1588 domain-containing protein [Verrucomicrobiales bacterium]|nr:DUF1588 domain-containing protein [Verrucomicrobiales bacterium]
MIRIFFQLRGWLWAGALAIPATSVVAQSETDLVSLRFYQTYCLKCHGGGDNGKDEIKGEFDLQSKLAADPFTRETLEKLIEQIDSEEMPTKRPEPTRAERDDVLKSLRTQLAALPPEPEVTVRRLTKREYRHTMRDLLGVDLRAGEFLPPDGQGESGFSNDREALAITPDQMERYFESAARALDGAFAIAKADPVLIQLEGEKMERSVPGVRPHRDGVMVNQPSHAISAELDFPVDGHYEFSIDAAVFGEPCIAQVQVSGETVAEVTIQSHDLAESPTRSAIGFVKRGRHPVKLISRNLVPHVVEPPDIVRLADENGKKNAPKLAPLPNETEESKKSREALNYKSYGLQESLEFLRFFGPEGDPRKIDQRRKYYHERHVDFLRIRKELAAKSGLPEAEIIRLWTEQNRERLADNAKLLAAVEHVKFEDWLKHQGKLYVDSIVVSGPVAPSLAHDLNWSLLESLRTEIDPVTLVREFAHEAFRRPVSDKELAPHLEAIRSAQARDEEREDAVKLALAAILISPDFLFRGREPDQFARQSALSYFLWESRPDIETADIETMIADSRADPFFETFADEWLEIGELGTGIAPDRLKFPDFTPEIAAAMREETHLFIAHLFRENRPVSDLLTSSKDFAPPALREFYSEGATTDQPNRQGLLGQGAVLVSTSSPARTNPVRRGKWVWENLLGQSVGEPLPDAGELPGDAGEARGKTLREELAEHRSREECARCHDKIDPIGFGLENFDATGRWRTTEAGKPVDASGELFGSGAEFSGPVELRNLLLEKHGQDLTENVVRRLQALFTGQKQIGEFDPISPEIGMRDLLERVIEEAEFE